MYKKQRLHQINVTDKIFVINITVLLRLPLENNTHIVYLIELFYALQEFILVSSLFSYSYCKNINAGLLLYRKDEVEFQLVLYISDIYLTL